ncbi:hypothetical protein ACFLU6_11825, partial [Acidobacteriota bacterium]
IFVVQALPNGLATAGDQGEILIRVGKSEEESDEAVAGAIRQSLYNEDQKKLLEEGRFDLNVIGVDPLKQILLNDNPLGISGVETSRETYENIGKAIQDFRTNHGPITDLTHLSTNMSGTVDGWDRMESYLKGKAFFGEFLV